MELAIVGAALRGALDLVTPTACAGCGRTDQVVCERCAALLYAAPRRADTEAPLLRDGPATWAAASYAGPTRDIVLAWKRGRADVGPVVHEAVRELVDRWAALGEGPSCGVVGVVPAPSGWVRRATGLLVVRGLADVVAGALAAARPGLRAVVVDAVRRPGFGHLAGLGAGARAAARTASALRVRSHPPVDVWVLVDDVVTTGATLRATAAALTSATGRPVALAFALAATPRRSGVGLPRM